MSIDDFGVVDAIGLSPSDNIVLLYIFDGWDWSDEWVHFHALQEKINVYFSFVQSGQVYEAYPAAVSRPMRIKIVAKYPLPDFGGSFMEQASAAAAELSLTITHEVRDG